METPYVLMLEYDEDDQYITNQYFIDFSIQVKMVNTSDELFHFLGHCIKNKTLLPSLILLDYHSGPLNAKEIMKMLKWNQPLSHIPLVVLSGSKNNEIIKECYQHGASSFIQKPASDSETAKKISLFLQYWFNTVELSHPEI
jgi:CheY-like chemotaxis protein